MSCTTRSMAPNGIPLRPLTSLPPIFLCPLRIQRRTFLSRLLRRRADPKRPDSPAAVAAAQKRLEARRAAERQPPQRGSLLPGSILDDIPTPPEPGPADYNLEKDYPTKRRLWRSLHPGEQKLIISNAQNHGWDGPVPKRRIPPMDFINAALKNKEAFKPSDTATLRQKVTEMVKRHGRLDRSEIIARSERSLQTRSPFIKTSIKKLQPLARQIAGKKLEDAMVQMRFSKKRAAADVLKHLEYARNKAMVDREMGIGKAARNISDAEEVAEGKERERLVQEREEREAETEEQTVVVRDRKNRKQIIDDRSAIYVDQAWVGRGKWEFDTDYRARGRGYRLYKPYTTISVLLKEERTRLRQAEERQTKRENKPVWVPLPDRPVTAQRQYPLW